MATNKLLAGQHELPPACPGLAEKQSWPIWDMEFYVHPHMLLAHFNRMWP